MNTFSKRLIIIALVLLVSRVCYAQGWSEVAWLVCMWSR
jgi:hypothetical protein